MPLPFFFERAVMDCAKTFPLKHDPHISPLAYGTAGFRCSGINIPPVAARVAFVAVLRAYWAVDHFAAPAGCAVGCMITASHNPAVDNGLKLVDVDGGMLATSWEAVCTAAANAASGEALLRVLEEWRRENNISIVSADVLTRRCGGAVVHLARDTRPSGVEIMHAVQSSLRLNGIAFVDHGIIATPQIHFILDHANRSSAMTVEAHNANYWTLLYYQEVLSALAALLNTVVKVDEGKRRRQKIVIDAANGVGTFALRSLLHATQSFPTHPLEQFFEVIILNDQTDDADALNNMCGADHAQKTCSPSDEMKKWASAYEKERQASVMQSQEEVHYYSLDGDADRVVAFFCDHIRNDAWHLLDGDRMSILFALALRQWIGQDTLQLLDLGVVQTAYANGASTDYLQEHLGLRVYSAATGVKHLHPIAHQRDIGVYFEANGHGTVLLNNEAIASKLVSFTEKELCVILEALSSLFSQVCGDAIADLFACEVALLALQMNFHAWVSLYEDLPSLQTKVVVTNPKAITNTADERRVLTPPGLQEAIDAVVARYNSSAIPFSSLARAFVRPSGTEALVRVYAEARDAAICKSLSTQVEDLVKQYCE